MKKIIVTFLLGCILFSCKKSSNTEEEYYAIEGLVLDHDSHASIAGAKVYVYDFVSQNGYKDSAISDGNGRVSFTYRKEGQYKLITATKDNYLKSPTYGYFILGYISRTDTVYLGRPSYVQLTVHKTGTYLPSDSIAISVSGDYYSPSSGHTYNYRFLLRDKAEAPDRVFNLYTLYDPVSYNKLHFQWDIIRNGTPISTQTASVDLIQFGTKNFTLNY